MESGARRSRPQTPGTCDGGATKAVSDPVLSLSDKEIQEKIERLTSFLSGNQLSSFPDKGLKIRVILQVLKEEQKRRRQHRHPVRVVDEVLPKYNFYLISELGFDLPSLSDRNNGGVGFQFN